MRIQPAPALTALLLLCVITSPVRGQVSFGGTPVTILSPGKLPHVLWTDLPAVDVAPLLAEDAQRLASGDKKMRFGVTRPVDIGLSSAGSWHELPDGRRVWRVGIHCPDASSVSFVFDDYRVVEGGQVFVIGSDDLFIGAFEQASAGGATSMAVMPVDGDRVIVEYIVPAGHRPGALHIGRVTHGYKPLNDTDRGFGASGSCNNNVVCPEWNAWDDQIRSVAKIINGGDWCTGQLINDCSDSGTPYFLTANHCVDGENPGNWVFLFNYESPTCTPNANGPVAQTVSGASLLHNDAGSDVALLQLNSAPPSNYGVYYTGWDRSGTAPTSGTGIHHPAGDVKKITFDDDAATTATYGGASCWRIANWEDGTTEGGSSGSGLWNQDHRLIGQLYGGQASCANNVNDYYGRFSVSAPDLTTWLGSCGNTRNGYDPNASNFALDAQLYGLDGFTGSSCSGTRSPAVTVRNAGTTTLTSFQLSWTVNGGAGGGQSWNGSLVSGATVTINLPQITLGDGPSLLSVSVGTPNGGSDQNPANDTSTSSTMFGTSMVTLQLNLDRYGAETTWRIKQGQEIMASGGPYTTQASNGVYPQSPINVCLPDGCFELQVLDSYGDGICCNYGNGNFSLTGPDGTLVTGDGQFTTQVTYPFCITSTINVSVKAMLEGPYDNVTGQMRDDLRQAGIIPATEPYTALGYTHVNGGGGETVAPAVLAVTGNNAIVDWVVVELRTPGAPYTVLATRSALLQRDGDVTGTDGVSPVAFVLGNGEYQVALRHRNHLGVMTATAVALSSTAATVDFRSVATGTWGTNARKTIGSTRALWAGNARLDGQVKYTGSNNDRDPILIKVGNTAPNGSVNGYFPEDVNLNGSVKYTGNANDRDPILVNVGNTTPNAVRTEQLP